MASQDHRKYWMNIESMWLITCYMRHISPIFMEYLSINKMDHILHLSGEYGYDRIGYEYCNHLATVWVFGADSFQIYKLAEFCDYDIHLKNVEHRWRINIDVDCIAHTCNPT